MFLIGAPGETDAGAPTFAVYVSVTEAPGAIGPGISQRMAEFIPRAEYVYVPGGTHTAPLERPGLVNAAIEKFIGGIDASAARAA